MLSPPNPTSSGGGDDGFEERDPSEGRSDFKRRLYTILDRQSLRRVQVRGCATGCSGAAADRSVLPQLPAPSLRLRLQRR